MGSPVDLHAAVKALLQGIGNTTTYDVEVPATPPADSQGRVYPYYLLTPSAGAEPVEADTPAAQASGDVDWLVQVTVVGGTLTRVLEAARLARAALARARLADGVTPLREVQMRVPVQVDEDASPHRLFLPLQFECVAT